MYLRKHLEPPSLSLLCLRRMWKPPHSKYSPLALMGQSWPLDLFSWYVLFIYMFLKILFQANNGGSNNGPRRYTTDFEPVAERPFDDVWERELTCVSKVKDKLHRFIQDQINCNRVPLCINPSSAAFKSFASSTVAHPSELPPSPHHWE